jgi:hypothetical protein
VRDADEEFGQLLRRPALDSWHAQLTARTTSVWL